MLTSLINGGLALWQQEGHAQGPSSLLTLALFVHSGPGENAIMLLTFPSFHPSFPPPVEATDFQLKKRQGHASEKSTQALPPGALDTGTSRGTWQVFK